MLIVCMREISSFIVTLRIPPKNFLRTVWIFFLIASLDILCDFAFFFYVKLILSVHQQLTGKPLYQINKEPQRSVR